jgi:pilus assembly protein CpaB
MNSRLRLLLIFVVLIIIVGVVIVAVLPGLNRPAPVPNVDGGTPGASSAAVNVPTIQPTYTEIPLLNIVVAIQPISRGQLITPDMVAYRGWPEEAVPLSAITELEAVIGKIARTDIYRESPITNVIITENLNDLGAVGSDAAAMLPAGTRMISLPIDRLTSAGYALQPGDRVDMIISLLFVDIDEDFQSMLPNSRLYFVTNEEGVITTIGPYSGRDETGVLAGRPASLLIVPSEWPRPRLTTQMTVQNALVVYVGTFPEDGRLFGKNRATPVPSDAEGTTETTAPPAPSGANTGTVATAAPTRPDIISLAVSPQEAVMLTYFVESKIPVTFALRPASETGTQSTQSVSLDYVMGQYSIQLPARRPYSIEPAIRSIRQLIASAEISLQPEATAVPPAPTR